MWKTNKNKNLENYLKRIASRIPSIQSSRHACAIVHKGKVIATGVSQRKTHPMMTRFQSNKKRIFLHAEVDAIVKAIRLYGEEILKDCDLYVLRLTKGHNIGNSKPCPGCQRAIEEFRIKNTYWS